MDKSKIYLDLSKCTEEQQIKAIALLPEPINEDDYDITHLHLYLIYDDEDCMWWVSTKYFLADKTELTYPDFIKLFDGGETVKSDNTQTLHNALEQIEKLESDKAELLEALEIFIEQNTPTFTSHDYEFPEYVMKAKSLIQKHKQ